MKTPKHWRFFYIYQELLMPLTEKPTPSSTLHALATVELEGPTAYWAIQASAEILGLDPEHPRLVKERNDT